MDNRVDSWHSFVFCSFSLQNLINNHMMVSKLAIRPISPFLQRPGSQIFSVIGGHDTKLIVSSTFRAEVYVSKNEMPSQFEKMMQGAFHFSNCLLHNPLPLV